MATTTVEPTQHSDLAVSADWTEPIELSLFPRIRKFLWISCGLFSAASFAIPAFGAVAFGTSEGLGTSFLAAIVSACLFGVASLLHFGPDVV